jgi:hypothetical protein
MAILGTLLKKGIRLRDSIIQEYSNPYELQKNTLQKLMVKARNTEFGIHYDFRLVLREFKKMSGDEFYQAYQKQIPIFDYNKIYAQWWYKTREGKANVCWPGMVKYFALSSGTSETASKYIPVTKSMMIAIQRAGIRQILSLSKYNLPDRVYEKGMLMLGGSTDLNRKGTYFEGDLSGITAGQIPFWLQFFYKPGQRIAKNRDWDAKLNEIVLKAKDWDIGYLVGVPAWIQILMEKIITHYKLNNIHEIWPNLDVYVHGGVSFEPYRKGFDKLLGRPITYIETYLASEGFIAFQALPGRKSMRMVLNNGIFYEFVPFNDDNFTDNGEVKPDAKTLMIHQIEENKDYAILLSTCSGAWRYLIGDVVRFVDKEESEIIITGRTKHFLSLCGEHLSVDNMNKAIEMISKEMDLDIREFTVAGKPDGSLFSHHWYVGCDTPVDENVLIEKIDACLKVLNDDYAVERAHALKNIYIRLLPTSVFYEYLRSKGKVGGQNKFPRVLKKDQLSNWESFISNHR